VSGHPGHPLDPPQFVAYAVTTVVHKLEEWTLPVTALAVADLLYGREVGYFSIFLSDWRLQRSGSQQERCSSGRSVIRVHDLWHFQKSAERKCWTTGYSTPLPDCSRLLLGLW